MKDEDKALVGELFTAIEHGDEGHRAWLKAELYRFFKVRSSQLSADLAQRDAEVARLREALTKIGNSAPSHCVCCTMMGSTARTALEKPHD